MTQEEMQYLYDQYGNYTIKLEGGYWNSPIEIELHDFINLVRNVVLTEHNK